LSSLDVRLDPDVQEEHRDEQVTDGREFAPDALHVLAAGQGDAGDEGSDDRREPGRLRDFCQPERERENDRHQRPWPAGDAIQGAHRGGRQPDADDRGNEEERDGHENDPSDTEHGNAAFGYETHDDGKDH
jgi:hypothetical protein